MWTVHRDVRQVLKKLRTTVGTDLCFKEVWTLVDKCGCEVASLESRISQDGTQESDVGSYTANTELSQCTVGA